MNISKLLLSAFFLSLFFCQACSLEVPSNQNAAGAINGGPIGASDPGPNSTGGPTVTNALLAVPTNLIQTGSGINSIAISWQYPGASTGVTFNIYSKTQYGTDAYVKIASGLTSLSYNDQTVYSCFWMDYEVTTVVDDQESAPVTASFQTALQNGEACAVSPGGQGGSSTSPPPVSPGPAPSISPSANGNGGSNIIGANMSVGTCSPYNIHPGSNLASQINAVPAGGTVCFAPGTYTLQSSTSNISPAAIYIVGNNRRFVGNGAIIDQTTQGNQMMEFDGTSDQSAYSSAVVEITGFVFTNGVNNHRFGSFNVHDNSFQAASVNLQQISGSQFNHNTFYQGGMNGYIGNNATVDYNRFDDYWEPMHFFGPASGVDLSYNVMTGISRYGMELQAEMDNLTVTHNWFGLFKPTGYAGKAGANGAISGATGGTSSTTNGSIGAGHDITYSDNFFLHTAADGSDYSHMGSCLEIMGTNVHITNNIFWGWDGNLASGTWGGSSMTGNRVYGFAGSVIDGGDNVSPPPVPLTITDTIQPLSAYKPSSTPPTTTDQLTPF